MKICDKCGDVEIGMILIDQISHTEFDFCKTCAKEFEEWKELLPEQEKRKPGRPRKDGSN